MREAGFTEKPPEMHIDPDDQRLFDALRKIDKQSIKELTPEERQKIGEQIMELNINFFEHNDWEMPETDWQKIILKFSQKNPGLIIRREDKEAVFDVISKKNTLDISFKDKIHKGDGYPNASCLGEGASGLITPLTRGFSGNSFNYVVGFERSKDLRVRTVNYQNFPHYSSQLDTAIKKGDTAHAQEIDNVRIVDGQVPYEDIKFILLTTPRVIFPEDQMTDLEEDNPQIKRINRLFLPKEKSVPAEQAPT